MNYDATATFPHCFIVPSIMLILRPFVFPKAKGKSCWQVTAPALKLLQVMRTQRVLECVCIICEMFGRTRAGSWRMRGGNCWHYTKLRMCWNACKGSLECALWVCWSASIYDTLLKITLSSFTIIGGPSPQPCMAIIHELSVELAHKKRKGGWRECVYVPPSLPSLMPPLNLEAGYTVGGRQGDKHVLRRTLC